MPRPYSADRRERALVACERREGSRAEVARRFSVGVSTLHDWLRQAREEGRRAAKPARGGRPLLGGGEARAALEGALAERGDATLAELAAGRLDPAGLIFVDESGIDTRMTRRFARARRGERARGAVPAGRWRRLTLIGALGLGGLAAVMTVAAQTTTAVFRAFVEQVLAPALRDRPGALVVMDDLAPHEAAAVHAAIRAAGLEPRLLPRYSPDLSPI